jgi:rhomboid protease GluP
VSRGAAPVTCAVAVLLAAVYLLLGSERELLTLFFALDRSQLGEAGWFRLFTASAVHADLAHLGGNLLGLLLVGSLLEPRLGSARFSCVLLGSALAAALITTGLSASPSVGASGAVYGLLGALLATSHLLARGSGEPPPSLPMLALLVALVAYDNTRGGVDYWAHAGGAAGGAVLGVLGALLRKPPFTGLRVAALVLAGLYALAGGAGWVAWATRVEETLLGCAPYARVAPAGDCRVLSRPDCPAGGRGGVSVHGRAAGRGGAGAG